MIEDNTKKKKKKKKKKLLWHQKTLRNWIKDEFKRFYLVFCKPMAFVSSVEKLMHLTKLVGNKRNELKPDKHLILEMCTSLL